MRRGTLALAFKLNCLSHPRECRTLEVLPQGHVLDASEKGRFVSCYLKLLDVKLLPADELPYVRFEITLVNRADENKSFTRGKISRNASPCKCMPLPCLIRLGACQAPACCVVDGISLHRRTLSPFPTKILAPHETENDPRGFVNRAVASACLAPTADRAMHDKKSHTGGPTPVHIGIVASRHA